MPSIVTWEERILPPLIDYLDKFHNLYLFLYPRWVGAEKDRPKIEPPKNVQHGNQPNLMYLFLNGFPHEFLLNLYNNYLRSTNWNTSPLIDVHDMTVFINAIKDHVRVFNKLSMDAKIFNKLFSGNSPAAIINKVQFNHDYEDDVDLERDEYDSSSPDNGVPETSELTHHNISNNINSSKPNLLDDLCYKAALSPNGVCGIADCNRIHDGAKYENLVRTIYTNVNRQVQTFNNQDSSINSSLFPTNKSTNVMHNNTSHYKILKRQVA